MLEFAYMTGAAELRENLERVRERIERAAARARRSTDEITLIAVSKTHPAGMIRELHAAGVRHFGENRVQEWESKRPSLNDLDATWHLVGHLQSNKASRAASLFHSVDSVDSPVLGDRLAAAAAANPGRAPLRMLMEVKLDPAPAKSGADEEELSRLAEHLLGLAHVRLAGLMSVPPYCEDPERVRPFFRRLRERRDALESRFGVGRLPVLSMGMSHDFEVAIEEGATEIRVGTALFGGREKV